MTVGLDGTCMLMHKDGWREAMVGTVALYDKEGERQHTLYIGSDQRQLFLPTDDN